MLHVELHNTLTPQQQMEQIQQQQMQHAAAMQRMPAPAVGGGCACVVVLCGAPAAGKSSLARQLCSEQARPGLVSGVHHIEFDAIEQSSIGAVCEPHLISRACGA